MKRIILLLIVAVVVLGGGYWGYMNFTAKPTPAAPPVAEVKAATASVVSAEASVVPSRHAEVAFKTGGRITEIAVRAGESVKAGAVLAKIDDTTIKAQVTQAEATLNVAQKQLAQLRAGAPGAERQAAKDALESAQSNLARVQAGPTAEQLAQLKANLDNAKAALDQAQAAYDRAGGPSNPYIALSPQALQLEQATNAYLAAQAGFKDAQNHPTESEIKAARVAVTQAESAVARLDPTPEQIALAEAQVSQAQAALDLARVALQDSTLAAPFDGTVVDVTAEVGEVASPGAPLLSFADLSNLEFETVDLAELDVARVSQGQEASIKVDALPGKTLTGKVARIAHAATDHRGDKVYKVTISLPGGPPDGLRWGMTANVEIQAR